MRAALCTIVLLVTCGASASARANDTISFEAYTALEHDGRVRVDELDIDQREGDFVGLFEAKAKALAIDAAQGSLKFGYDLSHRSHFEFPDLNRQSHRFSADGHVKAGRAELSGAYDFIHFRLGGDALVNIQGVEPKLALPVEQSTRLTVSYRYENWDFANVAARDTDNHMVAVGAVHQFSPQTQLTARVRYEKVDAVEPRFDLHGYQINTTLSLPLRMINFRGTAKIEIEYRDRDYENITPSIGARRREERSVITGTSDLHLSDRIGLRTIVRYTHRDSNFPASNYEEIRASTGFVMRL